MSPPAPSCPLPWVLATDSTPPFRFTAFFFIVQHNNFVIAISSLPCFHVGHIFSLSLPLRSTFHVSPSFCLPFDRYSLSSLPTALSVGVLPLFY